MQKFPSNHFSLKFPITFSFLIIFHEPNKKVKRTPKMFDLFFSNIVNDEIVCDIMPGKLSVTSS